MTREKKLNALYLDGYGRKRQELQEFEILDYSATWIGQFAFARFEVAEFLVVELSPNDIASAAKSLGYIDAFFEKGPNEIEIVVEWDDKRRPSFEDWYSDQVSEELISRAIFQEISYKVGKINQLNTAIEKAVRERQKAAEGLTEKLLSGAA